MERILVAYATKHGSTEQVAAAIARALEAEGSDVDLRPAHAIDDLTQYDGVVLGGALYTGRLHRDARRFLRAYDDVLATLPVAVFAMGPLSMEETQVRNSRDQLERALAKTPAVKPVATTIFGGVVQPTELGFPFNKMARSDARDWTEIERWAREVATAFAARLPVATA